MNDRRSCALVFSTDENFSPLAKGLVLSVQQQCLPDEFSFHLIDIGCSPSTIEWMKSNGVQVHQFTLSDYVSVRSGLHIKRYMLAQFCRPFIPKIV